MIVPFIPRLYTIQTTNKLIELQGLRCLVDGRKNIDSFNGSSFVCNWTPKNYMGFVFNKPSTQHLQCNDNLSIHANIALRINRCHNLQLKNTFNTALRVPILNEQLQGPCNDLSEYLYDHFAVTHYIRGQTLNGINLPTYVFGTYLPYRLVKLSNLPPRRKLFKVTDDVS